jgi:hypothetical protein
VSSIVGMGYRPNVAQKDGLVVNFFEPRWHGFARWEIQDRWDIGKEGVYAVETIAHGWWRPPRGWKYREFALTNEPGFDHSSWKSIPKVVDTQGLS